MIHSDRYVGMGEVLVGRTSDVLKATLGSCVGIGFIWKKGGVCGLAHCLLSESPRPILTLGARYVNQAVPSLLVMMGMRDADLNDVDVIVAGGARMFSTHQGSLCVGRQNAEAAQKYLLQKGLQVLHQEIGGRRGRQMVIDCGSQDFSITTIARQPEEYHYGWI